MGKPIRVLMVEDSEKDTLLVLHRLRKNGYEPEHDRVETVAAMQTYVLETAPVMALHLDAHDRVVGANDQAATEKPGVCPWPIQEGRGIVLENLLLQRRL